MVLYVRELKEQDAERLRGWIGGHDDELQHRAQLVMLSSKGYRIPEIAEMLGCHPANLRKWIHRFNRRGCDGLVTVRSGGAKPRFSATQKARIVTLAKTPPRDLGLNYTAWTLHRLAEQSCARHIVDRISHECVRQILKEAGCSHRMTAD